MFRPWREKTGRNLRACSAPALANGRSERIKLDKRYWTKVHSASAWPLANTQRMEQPVCASCGKQIKPTDGVGVTPINQGLIKNAPHPNAARLWLEWSLSEEGQNLLAQLGYAVVRQGIKAVEPEANLEGVKFLPRDDDFSKFNLIPERTKRWEATFAIQSIRVSATIRGIRLTTKPNCSNGCFPNR